MSGSLTLRELEGRIALLEIRCTRCDRYGRQLLTRLIERYGRDARQPASRNGIVERLHRTLLDEHFRVERRKTWFETIDEIVLDDYVIGYNTRRPHQAAA